MKLGIVRETKNPPDKRVPFTPHQCRELLDSNPSLDIIIQPDTYRCYKDEEYKNADVPLQEDVTACNVLIGVKEVAIDALIDNKTYIFFSHTAKKQPYNRDLIRAILDRRIRLIDYEYLTRRDNTRVVAFGRWAGIVGAYNGLRAYGLRENKFDLKAANLCDDMSDLLQELKKVEAGQSRIAITGGGRVAGGAIEILEAAGISRVSPEEYMDIDFDKAVYVQLEPWHYTARKDGKAFSFDHFVQNPSAYENSFEPYAMRTDIFIPCHFWDPQSPVFLTDEIMADSGFPIKVIADISCDISGPIPSTIRASTIAEPLYGYDPHKKIETAPFLPGSVTVMAVDNLPGELPRDASEDFGNALIENVIPALLGAEDDGMLERATIAENGALTERYAYLQDYVDGK